jgi:SAM-dependent methyltransferase
LTYWRTLCVKHNGASARMHGQQVYVAWKPLLWFVKGTKLATPDYRSDFIESKQPEKILHELEQSPKEAEHVIEWLTVEGQTVIDPFCGSGTTALAALKLRRRFVGIDINPIALNSARTNIELNLQLVTEAV